MLKVVFGIVGLEARLKYGGVPRIVKEIPEAFLYLGSERESNGVRLGSTWGHFMAWKGLLGVDCDWEVVLEDDTILCSGFAAKVRARLEEADAMGAEVVQFSRFDQEAPHKDPRWIWHPAGKFMVTLANGYKRGFAERLCESIETSKEELFGFSRGQEVSSSDAYVRDFLKLSKTKFLESIPNLAQHDVDMPSSLGRATVVFGRKRISRRYDPEGS
jgi:hypothetical protein